MKNVFIRLSVRKMANSEKKTVSARIYHEVLRNLAESIKNFRRKTSMFSIFAGGNTPIPLIGSPGRTSSCSGVEPLFSSAFSCLAFGASSLSFVQLDVLFPLRFRLVLVVESNSFFNSV
jgi:hypothetical protein